MILMLPMPGDFSASNKSRFKKSRPTLASGFFGWETSGGYIVAGRAILIKLAGKITSPSDFILK